MYTNYGHVSVPIVILQQYDELRSKFNALNVRKYVLELFSYKDIVKLLDLVYSLSRLKDNCQMTKSLNTSYKSIPSNAVDRFHDSVYEYEKRKKGTPHPSSYLDSTSFFRPGWSWILGIHNTSISENDEIKENG